MLTRRHFVKQSSLLTAGLMMDRSSWFAAKKNIGIQLYTVRDEVKDLPGTLAKIAQAGYTQVELFGYSKRQYFGHSIKETAALLKKNGLTSPSGHYMLPDFLNTDYNWESWKEVIEDANMLGHKYIVIPYLDDKHRDEKTIKLLAEHLNKGGELAKKAGMLAGYHNHNFEFEKLNDKQTRYDYLLKNTDPRYVKFEMDIYWVKYAGQDPIALFKKHPGRFPMWHMKDMEKEKQGNDPGQTCEVGKGIIDWKAIYAYRKLAGLEYLYVEQEQYRHPVFECIKTSYDYIANNIVK